MNRENKHAMTSEFNARMVLDDNGPYRPETVRLAEDYLNLIGEIRQFLSHRKDELSDKAFEYFIDIIGG